MKALFSIHALLLLLATALLAACSDDKEEPKVITPSITWAEDQESPTFAADGGTTAELMTALEFNGDYYTLTGKGGSFEMTLDAQAVQSDNQASGATALTAVGWPSTDEAGE